MSGLLAALHRLEGRAAPQFSGDAAPRLSPIVPSPAERVDAAEADVRELDELIDLPSAAPSRHVDDAPSAAPSSQPSDGHAAFVAALVELQPAPALIAFIGIGLDEPFAPTVRELAEATAGAIGRDVVLLGPGLFDAPGSLESQWAALHDRAAYGFVHATAEFAAGRIDRLRGVAGVVAVVDLERTSTRAVDAFRELARGCGIRVLGAVALAGE